MKKLVSDGVTLVLTNGVPRYRRDYRTRPPFDLVMSNVVYEYSPGKWSLATQCVLKNGHAYGYIYPMTDEQQAIDVGARMDTEPSRGTLPLGGGFLFNAEVRAKCVTKFFIV